MLRYPFFESAVHHAESAVKEFNTIILRAGGDENWSRGRIFASARENDSAVYVRDQHVRDSQLSLSGTAAHGIFVHLYLNGIYWGVYNVVERPDRRFLASYYGGDSADWFAINHSGVVGKPNHPRWYITVYRYAREHDLSEPAKYREMKTLLNTAQFSDYILLNWFSGTGGLGENELVRRDSDSPSRCRTVLLLGCGGKLRALRQKIRAYGGLGSAKFRVGRNVRATPTMDGFGGQPRVPAGVRGSRLPRLLQWRTARGQCKQSQFSKASGLCGASDAL